MPWHDCTGEVMLSTIPRHDSDLQIYVVTAAPTSPTAVKEEPVEEAKEDEGGEEGDDADDQDDQANP